MYESAGGVNKGYYFGSSLGTAQMTIALTFDEDRLTRKLNKVVHWAPCTILGRGTTPDLSQESMEEIAEIVNLGIYSRPSVRYEEDRAKVCANLDQNTCDKWPELKKDPYNWRPTRQNYHVGQNKLTQRFQRFVEDWPANTEAEEYNLANIKNMPVSFYVPSNDGVCMPERA